MKDLRLGDVSIRRAGSADIHKLQRVGRQTFADTFTTDTNGENMREYLKTKFSLPTLASELAEENSEFYFALLDVEVIGYLKLNVGNAQSESMPGISLEIERIYVLQEYHGRKVGQRLFEKALSRARLRQVNYIWLGVWAENKKAVRFYRKNGFVMCGEHAFTFGDEEQVDIIMRLDIE